MNELLILVADSGFAHGAQEKFSMIYLPHLRALEALAYLTVEYAFSHFL